MRKLTEWKNTFYLQPSVARIIYNKKITPSYNGEHHLLKTERGRGCSNDPLYDKKTRFVRGGGTCFLVGAKNLALCAGHSILGKRAFEYTPEQLKIAAKAVCSQISLLFGNQHGLDFVSAESKRLSKCKRVISAKADWKSTGEDYALIEIDPVDAPPLEYQKSKIDPKRVSVKKIAYPNQTIQPRISESLLGGKKDKNGSYRFTISAAPGSSGAPVFDKRTNRVLALGTTDVFYETPTYLDFDRGCFTSVVESIEDHAGHHNFKAFPIYKIHDLISKAAKDPRYASKKEHGTK